MPFLQNVPLLDSLPAAGVRSGIKKTEQKAADSARRGFIERNRKAALLNIFSTQPTCRTDKPGL